MATSVQTKPPPSAIHSNYKCRKHNSQSNHIKKKKKAIKMHILPGKSTFPSQPVYPLQLSPVTGKGWISPGPLETSVLLVSLTAAFQAWSSHLLIFLGCSSAPACCCIYWWLANPQADFFLRDQFTFPMYRHTFVIPCSLPLFWGSHSSCVNRNLSVSGE